MSEIAKAWYSQQVGRPEESRALHIAQAVREALSAVVAPEVQEQILHHALLVAGFDSVPGPGDELREFLDHYLRQAIAVRLGPQSADETIEMLAPVLRMAELASRSAPPVALLVESELPTRRPLEPVNEGWPLLPSTGPPGAGATPSLLGSTGIRPAAGVSPADVAFLNRSGAEGLRRAMALFGRREEAVTEVRDLGEFIDSIHTVIPPRAVVVDCEDPPFALKTLATLMPDVPLGTSVFLWRYHPRRMPLSDAQLSQFVVLPETAMLEALVLRLIETLDARARP